MKVEFDAYNRPSRYPNKYRIKPGALLTDDWVVSRNPIYGGREKSKPAEEDLKNWLLEQGHYAHSN